MELSKANWREHRRQDYPMPNTSQYGADDAPYYPNTTDLPNPSGTDSSQAEALATDFFGYVPALGATGNRLCRCGLER